MKIIEQHLASTPYGLNLIIKTEDNKYYQQHHVTLEYNGGGAATWSEIDALMYVSLRDGLTNKDYLKTSS